MKRALVHGLWLLGSLCFVAGTLISYLMED
jgi:hypothetical protein